VSNAVQTLTSVHDDNSLFFLPRSVAMPILGRHDDVAPVRRCKPALLPRAVRLSRRAQKNRSFNFVRLPGSAGRTAK
jgi:hypothetical protein